MKNLLLMMCMIAVLTSCAKNEKMAPTEGRIDVQSTLPNVKLTKAKAPINLTYAKNIDAHRQSNYNAINKIPSGDFNLPHHQFMDKNRGNGLSKNKLTLIQPVIQNNIIYTLDTNLVLTATDISTQKKVFSTRINDKSSGVMGVGLAVNNNALFIATGAGHIYALDLNGKEIWHIDTKTPLKSQITLGEKQLYLISPTNKVFAIELKNGHENWSYQSTQTITNFFDMAQSALKNNILIVPFTTGEVMAFNALTGVQLWERDLTPQKTYNELSDLGQISAAPVIEDDIVYILGNGLMGAFDLKTGDDIYLSNISSNKTPLISGNMLFMIGKNKMLYALNKNDASLFYKVKLNSEKNGVFNSPILLKDDLILTSTTGDFIIINARTGTIKKQTEGHPLNMAPLLYKNMIFMYTTDADLIGYK